MTVFMRRLMVGLTVLGAARVNAQVDERPLKLVQEMRISGVDEDLSSMFGKFLVLPRGVVTLFDEVNVRFVYFDGAGKRTGTFGRKGSGPGEFNSNGSRHTAPGGATRELYQLLVGTVGDSMWVYAEGPRRFMIIAPDRRLVRTMLQPAYDATKIANFSPLALYAGDRMLGHAAIGTFTEFTESDGEKGKHWTYTDSALFTAGKDGALQRRVATDPDNKAQAVFRDQGRWTAMPIPFSFAPLRDVAQDGSRIVYVTRTITSATGGTFRVTVISSGSDTVLARDYPYTAPAVTKRRADSAYDAIEQRWRGNTSRPPQVTAELLRQIRAGIPPVEPPFTSVMLGLDGSIWLGIPRRQRAPTTEYLVLDDRGNALGTVRISGSLREATRTHVWVTENDKDGFSNIIRYRITS